MVTIRQATLEDKPAIFEFLKAAYGERSEFKIPDRWEWAFINNPFNPSDSLPIWIAVTPDLRVIGQSAALMERIVIGGQDHQVGWGIDFYVLPEYRGQGLGTKLQAANNENQEIFMSLSMAAGAAEIKSRIGLQPLPSVPIYLRHMRHEPDSVRETLLARIPALPEQLARLMAPILARVLTRRDRPVTPSYHEEIEIRRETAFTEAYDKLWQTLSPAFSGLVRRDARYLTWKFKHQPHVKYEVLGAHRDDELAGYILLRRARPPERNAGIIADLFTLPEDAVVTSQLLSHALAWFFEQKVSYVIAASSVPAFQAQYNNLGFKQIKTATPLARASVELPQTGWLLSKADQDWDQFPLA